MRHYINLLLESEIRPKARIYENMLKNMFSMTLGVRRRCTTRIGGTSVDVLDVPMTGLWSPATAVDRLMDVCVQTKSIKQVLGIYGRDSAC